MFASQLLRILQTFPANANNEICDFDTDEVKDTMKESPRRYTNPFLSDEENEKVNLWSNQELYTDKNVMECELPELLVCYKEGAFHVKDICVDEGIPHGEKILFDEDNHDILCISSPNNEDKHDDIIDDSLHTEFLKPEPLAFSPMEDYYMESNHHMDIGDNLDEGIERDLDIPVQDLQDSLPDKDCKDKDCKEEDTESLDPNELKNMSNDDDGISECAPEKLKSSAESDTVPEAIDNFVPEEPIKLSANLLDDKDQPLPSLKSLLESFHGAHDNNQQPCQSPVEETLNMPPEGNETEEVGTSVQTTIISNESMEGNNILNLDNGKPAISNDLHGVQNPETVHERGAGESSFSVAGPVSGLITYSGQIAFSGSISLRSDSSTTSTRSFAFPILQTEWNSSPVRMAKADRRRLQKHRGWRNGLLCCRF